MNLIHRIGHMMTITAFIKGFLKGFRNGAPKNTRLDLNPVVELPKAPVDIPKLELELEPDTDLTIEPGQSLELELLGSRLKLSQDEFFKRCSLIAGRQIQNLSELHNTEYLELKKYFRNEIEGKNTNG